MLTFGWTAFELGAVLYKFIVVVLDPKQDLDLAARLFAKAVVLAGVEVMNAIFLKRSLKGARPTPAAVIDDAVPAVPVFGDKGRVITFLKRTDVLFRDSTASLPAELRLVPHESHYFAELPARGFPMGNVSGDSPVLYFFNMRYFEATGRAMHAELDLVREFATVDDLLRMYPKGRFFVDPRLAVETSFYPGANMSPSAGPVRLPAIIFVVPK